MYTGLIEHKQIALSGQVYLWVLEIQIKLLLRYFVLSKKHFIYLCYFCSLSRRKIHLIYLLTSEYSCNYKQKKPLEVKIGRIVWETIWGRVFSAACDWSKAACAFRIITESLCKWNSELLVLQLLQVPEEKPGSLSSLAWLCCSIKWVSSEAVWGGWLLVPPWLLGSSVLSSLDHLLFRHEIFMLHATEIKREDGLNL